MNKKNNKKNNKKKTDWKGAIITSGIVIFIGIAMMGVIGFIIALNFLVVTPFVMGMFGVSSLGEDVREVEIDGRKVPNGTVRTEGGTAPNGEGIVDRTKHMWQEAKPPKKVALVAGIGLALPFIAVGIMYMMTLAVGYAVDIIFFVPIFLLVMWIYFRFPAHRETPLGKYLGHPIVGFIGIVGVVAILTLASLNYAEQNKYATYRDDMADKTIPLWTTAEDYDTEMYFDEVSGTWQNRTTIKTIDTVLFKVVDPFFNEAGFLSTVENAWLESYTDPYQESTRSYNTVQSTSDFHPIYNAKVTLTCFDKRDEKTLVPVGTYTNENGMIVFKNVPYGVYDMAVDAGGYLKWNEEVTFGDDFRNATIIVRLRPIYYKIIVHYEFSPETTRHYSHGWLAHEHTWRYGGGSVNAWAECVGGIQRDDWFRMRRQQSMYGFTNIPNPTLMNTIIPTYQNMKMTTQSMLYTLQTMIPTAMHSFNWEAKVQELKTDPFYYYHTVRLVRENSYAMDTREGVTLNHPIYYQQLPSPNIYRVDNGENMEDLEARYGAWLDAYRTFQRKPSDGSWTGDAEALAIAGDRQTHSNFKARFDSQHGSVAMIRDYEYIVWSTVSDGGSFFIQFEVTTTYTRYFRYTSHWGATSQETYTPETITDTFDLHFYNNLPTIETRHTG